MTTTTSRKPSRATNRKARKKARPRPVEPRDIERVQRDRMVLVGGVVSFCFMAVFGTCVYLQGCESAAFLEEAERNYLRRLRLDTQRGDIYDRNGEALATSVEVDTIYANPRRVEDPITASEALAEVLDLDEEFVIRRLTAPSHFRYIKRQVTADEAAQVSELGLTGIMVGREARRFYPKRDLAGQVLGVVGFDSRGQEGLEQTYDQVLRGGQLSAPYHRDAQGRYAMIEALPAVETEAGHALKLTIDEKIQAVAERELERACLASRALSGIALVMDVRTGDLLAMAHYPRFNPNRYRTQIAEDRAAREAGLTTIERFRNRSITDQYEPGSTFKVFTLAAALEEGIVTLDDTMDLHGGRYRVGRKWISDTHRFREPQSIRNVLKHSSNVGFIKLGQALGRERLHQYLTRFGFGTSTGVGLAGDARGLLRPPREWAEITLANIAFGQGVAVTPLQLLSGVAAIGNQGIRMRPRVVMAELDSDGATVQEYPPEALGRVVSAASARQTIEAMSSVVEYDGTGHRAWVYDYDVAGKTGTAQKPDMIAGGYSEDGWIASFVGLAPARQPRLATLVVVDEPGGQYYGGVVAAPAYRLITEWALNYLGVAPSYGSRERVRRKPLVRQYGQPAMAGEGAYYDYPEDRQPGVNPEEPELVSVPDFTDLSVRDAVRLAHQNLLTVELDGAGLVTGQSVLAGTSVPAWTAITVNFRNTGGLATGEVP